MIFYIVTIAFLKKCSFLIAKIANKACVIFAHRLYVYSQKRHKSNNEYKRKEYGIVNQKYKFTCISQIFFVPLHAKIVQERKNDMNIDELTSKAHNVHISIPYNPEDNLITFDDGVMTELECDENFVPPMLNAKDMRLEMTIDIKEGRMVEWTSDNGYLRMQAKVRDEGTYTLLDADKNPIWQINGYVPNRLIPSFEIEGDYGDYIELRINADGSISNWKKEIDLSVFIKEGHAPKPIKTNKWHKAENALWYIRSKKLNAEEINWLSEQLRKL